MTFVPKNWQDSPSVATPITAAALEDLELRLAAYTDEFSLTAEAYGATGDGTTDDTDAIQLALDDAEAAHGIVRVPAGTFVTDGLKIGSNTALIGDGIGTSTLKLKDSSGAQAGLPYSHASILSNKDSGTTGVTDVVIAGLEFDGNVTNNHGFEFIFAVEFFGIKRGIIRDCYFHDVRAEGIALDVNTPGTIVQNEDVLIENIILHNCGFLNGGPANERQGISVFSADRVIIRGVTANLIAQFIVDFEPYASSHAIKGCRVSDVTGYDCKNGVGFLAAAADVGDVADNHVNGVILRDGPTTTATYSVYLSEASRITVTGLDTPGYAPLYASNVDCIVDGPDPPWTAPTLVNSWVQDSADTPVGYTKDTTGRVMLRGLVSGGDATLGTVMFTLPVGYRPPKDLFFPVVSNSLFGHIRIIADGTVRIYVGSNTWLSFDGVTFRAA